MPFQRPRIPSRENGVQPGERAADLERLARLHDFLPPLDHTVARVKTYFAQNYVRGLNQALAQPAQILAAVEELVGCEHRQLSATAIDQELATGSKPSPETVSKEAWHARSEYVRYWVDAVLYGWRLYGDPTGRLSADDLLLPDDPTLERHDDWVSYRSEAKHYLLEAVALTPDGLAETGRGFAEKIRDTLSSDASIELPRKVAITLTGSDDVCFRARA
jgi:hypothetical protein